MWARELKNTQDQICNMHWSTHITKPKYRPKPLPSSPKHQLHLKFLNYYKLATLPSKTLKDQLQPSSQQSEAKTNAPAKHLHTKHDPTEWTKCKKGTHIQHINKSMHVHFENQTKTEMGHNGFLDNKSHKVPNFTKWAKPAMHYASKTHFIAPVL